MPEDNLRRTGTEQGAVEAAGIHGPGAGLPPAHWLVGDLGLPGLASAQDASAELF